MKTGPLERAILRVKDGNWAWGMIFARVVLGYLYSHPEWTFQIDALIPMPAYLEAGQDPRQDHARWVITQAHLQSERDLPFVYDPPLIVKTRSTPKMRSTSSAAQRRAVAEEIYQALVIPDPSRVQDKDIVVYDDVFTGGHTLHVVARRLKEAGAKSVTGLALSRQPWTPRR